MKIHLALTMTLGLACAGCAAVSKFKVGADGVYHFKDAPFTVAAPKTCLIDFSVAEKSQYVVFSTGAGYWMASGQYDLRIIAQPKTIRDESSFIEETREFLPRYLTQDNNGPSGLKFELQEEKQLQVGGKTAYRGIAVAKDKAVFVATAVHQDNWITVAGLVYPLEGNREATDQVPWKCYDEFVESVKKVD